MTRSRIVVVIVVVIVIVIVVSNKWEFTEREIHFSEIHS